MESQISKANWVQIWDLRPAARAAPAQHPADDGDPEDPVEGDRHRGRHAQEAVPAHLHPQDQLPGGRHNIVSLGNLAHSTMSIGSSRTT